jgi:hypothetical protein
MQIIKDGTGSGNTAKVDGLNRLSVAAVSTAELTSISSKDGKAFEYHFKRTLAAADTLENVAHLQYSGNKRLQIASIIISREDTALLAGNQAFVKLTSEVDYTSGGTIVDAVTLNRSSQEVLDATAYSGATDIVMDITNEIDLMNIVLENSCQHDFKGSLILNKGENIAIRGKSKSIGDILHITIFMFEVSEVI